MLHIVTRGARNGVQQRFSSVAQTWSHASVYVRMGRAGIGTGNGPTTGVDSMSTTLNQWERVDGPNGSSPANHMTI